MPNFPTQLSPVRTRNSLKLEIRATSGLNTSSRTAKKSHLPGSISASRYSSIRSRTRFPDRRYGVCTVLIPALGTRLVRNGVEAEGRSWPREREGRPFSTSALAFSESWTEAV